MKYVVIGGATAEVWAASVGISVRPSLDIDFTPNNSREKLDRRSPALDELGANIRAIDARTALEFSHDGESLGRSLVGNLIWSAGPFDLSFIPSGTKGYCDLARRARCTRQWFGDAAHFAGRHRAFQEGRKSTKEHRDAPVPRRSSPTDATEAVTFDS